MSETTQATQTTETGTAPVDATILGGAAGGEAEQAADVTAPVDAAQAPAAEPPANAVEEEKAPEAPVVPEDYEFSPPEGFEINDADLAGYKDLAKESGLTQEQFSKMTAYGLEYVQQQLGRMADARVEMRSSWRNELIADREISDGQGLRPEVKQSISRVIDAYGGDDLRAAFDADGSGDNPAIVRFFVKIGKAMDAAGSLDIGRPAGSGKPQSFDDLARSLYKKSGA